MYIIVGKNQPSIKKGGKKGDLFQGYYNHL